MKKLFIVLLSLLLVSCGLKEGAAEITMKNECLFDIKIQITGKNYDKTFDIASKEEIEIAGLTFNKKYDVYVFLQDGTKTKLYKALEPTPTDYKFCICSTITGFDLRSY